MDSIDITDYIIKLNDEPMYPINGVLFPETNLRRLTSLETIPSTITFSKEKDPDNEKALVDISVGLRTGKIKISLQVFHIARILGLFPIFLEIGKIHPEFLFEKFIATNDDFVVDFFNVVPDDFLTLLDRRGVKVIPDLKKTENLQSLSKNPDKSIIVCTPQVIFVQPRVRSVLLPVKVCDQIHIYNKIPDIAIDPILVPHLLNIILFVDKLETPIVLKYGNNIIIKCVRFSNESYEKYENFVTLISATDIVSSKISV